MDRDHNGSPETTRKSRGASSVLNVLIIAQYFPPDFGGSATRALNVAKGLLLNGCRVTIVTAFPHYPYGKIPEEYRGKLAKIEWLGKAKLIRTFILPLESKGIVRRMFLFISFAVSSLFALPMVGKTDVIWAANPDILSTMPAIIYGKLKRCPITTNVDDLSVEDVYDLGMIKKGSLMSKVIELIARVAYRKARVITPLSPGYVEPISRMYGVEKAKINVVRGGVDVAVFKPHRHQPRHGSKFIVLYSGAFSVAYNFMQVLKAAKIIEAKDRGIEFVLRGKGELADDIRGGIRQLSLKNVKVTDELLSTEKLVELLNSADVLIQPGGDYGKPHLGISTKLYEYQAVGKPIICVSSGTPGLYVSETESGIVVRPGDHKAIAEAVLHLKRNSNLARKMGRNGRKFVQENASIQAIGSQLKRIFERLVRMDN
jgi:colanic acid biosynthesis glycosyl transferase WcaI